MDKGSKKKLVGILRFHSSFHNMCCMYLEYDIIISAKVICYIFDVYTYI